MKKKELKVNTSQTSNLNKFYDEALGNRKPPPKKSCWRRYICCCCCPNDDPDEYYENLAS